MTRHTTHRQAHGTSRHPKEHPGKIATHHGGVHKGGHEHHTKEHYHHGPEHRKK